MRGTKIKKVKNDCTCQISPDSGSEVAQILSHFTSQQTLPTTRFCDRDRCTACCKSGGDLYQREAPRAFPPGSVGSALLLHWSFWSSKQLLTHHSLQGHVSVNSTLTADRHEPLPDHHRDDGWYGKTITTKHPSTLNFASGTGTSVLNF